MSTRQPRFGEGEGTERITAFSDGVFAIAITLLVLDLKLPELPEHLSNAELLQALLALSPKIFSYALSFLVVGFLWINHHRLFAPIRRYDQKLLWLNLFVLLFVAFLPFPTTVLGDYGNRTPAIVLYALTFAMVSMAQVLVWAYATRGHRLVEPDLDPRLITYTTMRGVAVIAIWLGSIPIAFISPVLASLTWMLLFPLLRIVTHVYYREEAEEEALEQPASFPDQRDR
jgi:uncharacterized membrane protein